MCLVQTLVIHETRRGSAARRPFEGRAGGAGRRGEVRQGRVNGSASNGSGSEFSEGPAAPAGRPRNSCPSKALCVLAGALPCSGSRATGAAAPSRRKIPAGRQQEFGIARCRLPAQAEVLLRPNEGVGRGADVHAGVVQHEVVERHELALGPEGGAGLRGIGSGEDAGADGRVRSRSSSRASASSAADSGPMRSASAAAPSAKAPGVGTAVGPAGQGFGGIEGPAAAQENTIESIHNKSLTQVDKLCHCLTRTPPKRASHHR